MKNEGYIPFTDITPCSLFLDELFVDICPYETIPTYSPTQNIEKISEKRTNCKFKLYELVSIALKNPNASKALKWRREGFTIQVNWYHFTQFYKTRGGSTAKEENIKNVFTRKQNGFQKTGETPEEGYDVVLTHINWIQPSHKKKKLNTPEQPSSPSFKQFIQQPMQQIQQPLQQIQQPMQQHPIQQLTQQLIQQSIQQHPIQQPLQQIQRPMQQHSIQLIQQPTQQLIQHPMQQHPTQLIQQPLQQIQQPMQQHLIQQPTQQLIQQPLQQHPIQQPMHQHPIQQPLQQHPIQEPMQQYPIQQPMQQYPIQQSMQQYPIQHPMQQYPIQQSMQQYPIQQSIQQLVQLPMQQQLIQRAQQQAQQQALEQFCRILNLVKDEDATKILLYPENIIEGESFRITDFLKRMSNNDKFNMVYSEFKDLLQILMASETPSLQNEFITLEQFNHFLLRFGPLSQCLEKIRDFVNAGAVDCFHGNITREESEDLLKKAFNEENCSHFLIRSVPIKIIKNDTIYVFAVSYIQGAAGTVNHTRIYTDEQHQLFHAREVTESGVRKQKREDLVDFKSYLELTLKLKQGDHCKPVTCSYFSSLHKEYPHLSEQDTENGYVVTSESIK